MGDMYFTDNNLNFLNIVQIIFYRDVTGQLINYDTRTKKSMVLLASLRYPNDAALRSVRTHVAVVHTRPYHASREVRAPSLTAFVDKVRCLFREATGFGLNMKKLCYNDSGTVWADPDIKHLVSV
ncbi:hypothetical protein EJB05_06259, partial [Eragrostis curvula]